MTPGAVASGECAVDTEPICSGVSLASPKSRIFTWPPVGDEDVPGFDVAVDDAACVRRVQRIGNLDSDVQHLVRLERTAGKAIAKRLSLHQLHDDERTQVVLTNVVNRADMRVVQRRCGARFGPETVNRLLVVG